LKGFPTRCKTGGFADARLSAGQPDEKRPSTVRAFTGG
jgi:hypothetical protein